MGQQKFSECEHWSKVTSEANDQKPPPPGTPELRVPWSGSALGPLDLWNLVPRARPIVVGVIGAHDAGKTTLLVGAYLHLMQKGSRLAGAQFAGSRTLGAWEALAAWVRFDDAARTPMFPPHTPRGNLRLPGLLHLALRNDVGELRDVLLTDAPGEWFARWAVKEDAPDAEGARWIALNANAFVPVVDCARLAGPERGSARNNARQLLERLGNCVAERPTVLVWAKADHEPNASVASSIRAATSTRIPHYVDVSTTVNRPETFASAIGSAIEACWNSKVAGAIMEPVVQTTPFGAYRGGNDFT